MHYVEDQEDGKLARFDGFAHVKTAIAELVAPILKEKVDEINHHFCLTGILYAADRKFDSHSGRIFNVCCMGFMNRVLCTADMKFGSHSERIFYECCVLLTGSLAVILTGILCAADRKFDSHSTCAFMNNIRVLCAYKL